MSQRIPISGSGTSTQPDAGGRRIAREALEQSAREISERQQMIYWNFQTTLPPIGLITRAWVEKRTDGEYQLRYEGHYLGEEDTRTVPESDIQGLDLKWEEVNQEMGIVSPSGSGQLSLYYDPRTFADEAVAPVLEKINKLVPVDSDHFFKKTEPPSPYLWILVGFEGGHIASSLFLKQGMDSPEAALKSGKQLYRKLANKIGALLEKARLEGRKPDIIWGMPISGVETIVEGASEEPEEAGILGALERLPMLSAAARHILLKNPPHTFSQMKFLYLPQQKIWDINYLVLRESNRVIMGARYFAQNHPLRARYVQALKEAEERANQNKPS